MTRRWNGKAVVDELAGRLWDTSTTFRAKIIGWINEIQDDIASELPIDFYKFKLKKLLPVLQEIVDLRIQKPDAPSAAIASGGSLTDGNSYKAYVSFLVYDDDARTFMESEASAASSAVTADASNKTIDLTGIDVMDGDTSVSPATIYRRIYLSVDSGSGYGEPFFIADIADNTTTTYSITAESSSTVTPVSDSEIDQLSEDHMSFETGSRYLTRESINKLRRYDPNSSESTSPYSMDFVGTDKIYLYPKLSSTATTAQRTLSYYVYRRPHEVFYDVDREMDLPISFRKALLKGVEWLAYDYRDRDGAVSKENSYIQYKREAIRRLKRQKGRPSAVRDVNGDAEGFEV